MKVPIVFACFISVIYGSVPSYIHVCPQNDPNFMQCVIDSANYVIPHMLKGDKEYGIPPLNPFKIKKVDVNPGTNLKFSVKDLSLYGLETANYKSWSMEKEKKFFHVELDFEYIQINGTYEMDGKILVLPIKGTGPMSLYLEKSKAFLDYHYDFHEIDKIVHIFMTDMKVNTTHANAKFQFDNLFNGDKVLGEQTNKFLNENWKAIFNEVAPSVHEVIATIAKNTINAFCDKVPYNEILPED